MTVQSIRGVVEAAIQRAASASGVDFGFLMGTARRESGYNPNAQAKTSSAGGLFQFIDQTWMSMLKQHGAKYGYGQYADMIQRNAHGQFYVPGAGQRSAVMQLKFDPHASAYMAGELAATCAAYLRGRVGREPTAGELYSAHMLGPAGSAKLIDAVRASPGANAAALFPEAAAANRPIFYRGGRPATVAEVYANLTSVPGGGTSAPPAKAVRDTGEPDGFIQYASAGRIDRNEEEQALVALILRGPTGGGVTDDLNLGSQTANSLFSTEMLHALSGATRT